MTGMLSKIIMLQKLKKYYSIELYLFCLDVNEYVQFDVLDFNYSQGSNQLYHGGDHN